MRDHLASAPRNATYTSPDVQNQVINILGAHVREKILLRVKQAQFYTVIADEVTDCLVIVSAFMECDIGRH